MSQLLGKLVCKLTFFTYVGIVIVSTVTGTCFGFSTVSLKVRSHKMV